ncbi:MAG: DUF5818 domain-containing protein [Terriglobales bacterium]
MKRLAWALAVVAFWSMTAALSFSQNQLDQQPCPDHDEDAVGCEPIAWSGLQEPVPLPNVAFLSDRQSDPVEGTVVKKQGQYCLRVTAEADFILDDQQMAQSYEGERVRIEGVVDREKKTLHSRSITPVRDRGH